jgi:hypothetical protein
MSTATATVAGSQAALKVLYPKGELPKSIQDSFSTLKKLKKETDFVGELAYVALQNANPQGSAGQFPEAQANIFQGNYLRFALTRVKHYGIARVDGEAAEAAVKSEGALVDLWDNETRGIATTEMVCLATYLFGSGDGVLGQISAGIATTTVTLAAGTNMNYFEINMTLKAVSAAGLASTVRSGGAAKARVVGIDRRNRTLTFSAALNTLITDVGATDWLVRSGDQHVAGKPSVIVGLDKVIEGGTAPGELWGLQRNSDPVRLAGQAIDYTGWATEDAIADASAQAGFQGIGHPNVLICNNIEYAALKKSLSTKIHYNRPGGTDAKWSFGEVTVEGDNGPITVVADPFCPRNKAYLVKMDAFSLFSLKAAPHLAKYDGIEFLRRPDEDSYEVRFAFYGQFKCKNPGPHVRLLGFGL